MLATTSLLYCLLSALVAAVAAAAVAGAAVVVAVGFVWELLDRREWLGRNSAGERNCR